MQNLISVDRLVCLGVSWCDDAWDEHKSLRIELKGPDLSITFVMDGSTALFKTRSLIEDKIRDHFDDCIILTDSNTWDPVSLATPRKVSVTSNTSAVHKMKGNVIVEGLRVCATMERDAGYIKDGGDQQLLSGISTTLTDETLLLRIVDGVNISNNTSRNLSIGGLSLEMFVIKAILLNISSRSFL